MRKILENKNWAQIFYKIVVYWFLLGYIVIPIFYTFLEAVTAEDSRDWFAVLGYLAEKNNQIIIWNTLKLGIVTVIVCGIIGVSLAFYMTYHCTRFKKLIHLILLTPMMVPGIIIVIAFFQLYGESGMITSILCNLFQLEQAPYTFRGFGGIVFVHAYTQYVHFYLQTYIGLKYVDYSEVEVARGLGASRFQIFKDVIFPSIKPAIILSAAMTFISGISSYAAPNIIGGGYKVLSTQIATSKANFDFQRAAIASIVMFSIGFCILLISQYSNGKNKAKRNLRATQYVRRDVPKLTVGRVIENILVFAMVLMIVLPILGIFYLSFMENNAILTQLVPTDFTLGNYVEIFQSRRTVDPFFDSLQMSMLVVGAGLLFTVPLAYMVAKKKSFTNNLAWFLITISWSIPGSVLAVNLISAFNQPNVFAFGNVLIGGYYILPIAYTINALPMMMNNNMIAMDNFNPVLEDASRGLGAGRVQTFIRVVLPMVVPGVISGCMMAIITTLGEYTMSNLLYGVHNLPISVAMLKRFTNYYFGETMAYATVVIAVCTVLFSIVFKLDKKSYF